MTFKRTMKTLAAWSAAAAICSAPFVAGAADDSGVAQRREAAIAAAARGADGIDAMRAALDDPSPLVRRAAIRGLVAVGARAMPALEAALGNSDFLVRRAALQAICKNRGADALPAIQKAVADENPQVRLIAVNYLVGMGAQSPQATALLQKAQGDADPQVREAASQALWPFHKETVLIRDRADYDHDVVVARRIPLPKDEWKFQTDPYRNGHLNKWFDPAFDAAAWKTIQIEQAWNLQGIEYEGIAWYRRSFEMPAQIKHVAVEIHFAAVDETAWVWINGNFVGQHDIGLAGWDKPFALDITKEVKWGAPNSITVRVLNQAGHGGIWKPVEIEVLE